MPNDASTPKSADDLAKSVAEQASQAFNFNMQMGRAFMEAWSRALAEQAGAAAPPPAAQPWAAFTPWAQPPAQPAQPAPPFPAANEASRIWIAAVTEATRRTQEAVRRGEVLKPDAYMDVWTKAAQDLGQAVVGDAAFATLTGEWVNSVSRAKGDAKRTAADQLRDLGFATHPDVEEVGKRLIELERRVHDLTILLEDAVKSGVMVLDETGNAGGDESGNAGGKSAGKRTKGK